MKFYKVTIEYTIPVSVNNSENGQEDVDAYYEARDLYHKLELSDAKIKVNPISETEYGELFNSVLKDKVKNVGSGGV